MCRCPANPASSGEDVCNGLADQGLLGVVEGKALLVLAPLVKMPFNATAPILNSLIGKYLPVAMHGRGFAALYGLGPLVGSLVPLLAGAVAQTYGLNWVFPVMAVFLFVGFPLPYLILAPAQGAVEGAERESR